MPTKPKNRLLRALAILLILCAATPTIAADPVLTPLVAEVLATPRPAIGSDEQRHLVYEVRLSNATASNIELRTMEVVDGTGKVVLSLGRDDIARRFSIGGRRGAELSNLGVGQFGVLFLHVVVGAGNALPRSLALRVSLRLVQPGIDLSMTVAQTTVADPPLVVLGTASHW